jgi:hypothetical protein
MAVKDNDTKTTEQEISCVFDMDCAGYFLYS